MKKFLVRSRTKDEVEASKKIGTLVGALSILILDFITRPWVLASLFYFVVKLARRLI